MQGYAFPNKRRTLAFNLSNYRLWLRCNHRLRHHSGRLQDHCTIGPAHTLARLRGQLRHWPRHSLQRQPCEIIHSPPVNPIAQSLDPEYRWGWIRLTRHGAIRTVCSIIHCPHYATDVARMQQQSSAISSDKPTYSTQTPLLPYHVTLMLSSYNTPTPFGSEGVLLYLGVGGGPIVCKGFFLEQTLGHR